MAPTFKQFLAEGNISSSLTDSSKAAKVAGRLEIMDKVKMDPMMRNKVKAYFKPATTTNFKDTFNGFVSAFGKEARAINDLKGDGVGPGELLAYFIFDNITVGGKNASIDLSIDGQAFAEVKGGDFSNGTIKDFKLSSDDDPAVITLLKDLGKFNDKYAEITGDDLPGWETAGVVATTKLRAWREIDLEALASGSGGGAKKAIELLLRTDGELVRKGATDDVIINVKTGKSIAPIKNLLAAKAAVDKTISTIDKIEGRWVDNLFKSYTKDKNFVLINSKNLQVAYFGKLKKEMLGLFRTTRNQPKAVVNLAPSKSKDEAKAEK